MKCKVFIALLLVQFLAFGAQAQARQFNVSAQSNSISDHHSVPTDTWITTPSSLVPFGDDWSMIDLVSDGANISLLQYGHYPILSSMSLTDWLVQGPLPLPAVGTATIWRPYQSKQQSLVLDATTMQPRTSGCRLRLTTYGATWSTSCASQEPMRLIYATATKSSDEISEYSKSNMYSGAADFPVITTVSVNTRCE